MVRTWIIQTLELIRGPAEFSTLEAVSVNDSFQTVLSYAAKAVERLS